jgi:hypothetical protein
LKNQEAGSREKAQKPETKTKKSWKNGFPNETSSGGLDLDFVLSNWNFVGGFGFGRRKQPGKSNSESDSSVVGEFIE